MSPLAKWPHGFSSTGKFLTSSPSSPWRLILEDHLALSFHLIDTFEAWLAAPVMAPPARVVRAAALGSSVTEATGDLAVRIQDDLQLFGDRVFNGRSDEWSQAVRFLLAAASFRPSVVAPITGAAKVLGDLHMTDALPMLGAARMTKHRIWG